MSETAVIAVVAPSLDPLFAVRRVVEFAWVVRALVFVPFVTLGWPAT